MPGVRLQQRDLLGRTGALVMIHSGALFGLGDDGASHMVCCDTCGAVAIERLAQHGGWGMWVAPQRSEERHRVRRHHCPQHVLATKQYQPFWNDWEWAK